jgi:hypothetical protein
MKNSTPQSTATDRLLLEPDTRVTCPGCKHEFGLAEGFARKTLEQFARASRGALDELTRSIRHAESQRVAQKTADDKRLLEERIKDLQDLTARQTKQHEDSLAQARELEKQAAATREKALTDEIATLRGKEEEIAAKEKAIADREQGLQKQIDKEATERARQLMAKEKQHLEGELKEKADQIAKYQADELELRKEKNKLAEEKAAMELNVQRRVDNERKTIEEKTRLAETEKSKLREAELQKKIDDMSAKLDEAQRKAAQGSQQLQGEVFEVMLEDQLREAFPFDTIEEVRKGARGGDVIQRVMTRAGQLAGSILWEAKRTTAWGKDWTAKLKDDQRAAGVEVGVIVSITPPKEFASGQPFGLYDDVWVTNQGAALPLAETLRSELIAVHKQRVISAGKGEKMEAVYDYLTSTQFSQKISAVYTAFKTMRGDLESEKTAMQQRWARREKQIQQATHELVAIAGDIQGLAQQELPQLEMETLALESDDKVGE